MTQAVHDRTRGRPREFDEDKFLDGAIALFSASGISGVAIGDLTQATGLTVGSVYKAYKDKEGVFTRALERYIALREAQLAAIFEAAPNARTKLAALLKLYVELSRGKEGKLGCMVVSGISDLGEVGRAAELLRAQLSRRQQMLTELIAAGQRDGSIGTQDDPRSAAEVLLALLQGMRVVGKGGTLTDDADKFVSRTLKLLD